MTLDPVVEALIVDLLLWLAVNERSREEVLDIWRTSCPRLPVWEEANDRGLVTAVQADGRCLIKISASGRKYLEAHKLSKANPGAQEAAARSDS